MLFSRSPCSSLFYLHLTNLKKNDFWRDNTLCFEISLKLNGPGMQYFCRETQVLHNSKDSSFLVGIFR